MEFHEDKIYHIYNRGNNKQLIFFNPDNYVFFLGKIRKYILPYCEILNYSLMPNHFHFLVYSDIRTVANIKHDKNVLSEGFRQLLSSYSQAINKQEVRTGSLFTQNTKAKCMDEGDLNYGTTCFHYIHQNAFKAGLVSKLEDWDYSSFRDYIGCRNGTLCNKKLAFEILDINPQTFYEDSYKVIDGFDLNSIF